MVYNIDCNSDFYNFVNNFATLILTEDKMQDFELKTKIFFGEGSLDHLLQKKSKNAMIIADPFTVQSGIIKHITDRLDKDGIPYKIFDNVVPDPPMDRIVLGVKAALEQMPDCLMAVGGG